MYWLNYLDRNAIALARLDDLEEDLNLTSTEYQTCVSILFVGYILGQVPSNMLLTRCRPSYYMAACMALWAVVSGLTALSTNFTGLLLTRFFLGVVEAPFYPGALYILGIFYSESNIIPTRHVQTNHISQPERKLRHESLFCTLATSSLQLSPA